MTWRNEPSTRQRVALAILGGISFAGGFPPVEGGAGWVVVGMASLILSVHGAPPLRAFFCAFIGGWTLFALGGFWVSNVFGFWGFVLAAPMSIFTIIFALGIRHQNSLSGPSQAILGAALWAGLEFIRGETGPLANVVLMAGATPSGRMLAPARIVGLYGLSFLLALLAFFVAAAVKSPDGGRGGRRRCVVGVLLVILVWGGLVSFKIPEQNRRGPVLNVLAIQAVRVPVERLKELTKQALRATKVRVDLVVWPEYAIEDRFVEEDSELRERLARLCRSEKVSLVFGNKRRVGQDRFLNAAFVMDESGELTGFQGKCRPVTVFYDGEPAESVEPVAWRDLRLGLPICYDLDHGLVSRRIAAAGAGILISPTRDSPRWGRWFAEQRSRLVPIRAVATGLDVLRVNGFGPTVVARFDGSWGEGLWANDEGWVLVTMQPRVARTPYMRWGWLVGPLMAVIGLGSVILRLTGLWAKGPSPFVR